MRKSAKEALTQYSKVKITFKKKKVTRELEPVNKSFLVADLFRAFYEPRTIELNEYLYAAYVDAGKRPLAVVKISDGRLDSVTVDIRAIVRIALECNANSVFLCHNHPSGTLKPSLSDKLITKELRKALHLFSIDLVDHIILTEAGYLSLADEGLL